jgi:hypothetical protein
MDQGINLELLYQFASCAGSGCPATYRTSRGTMAVQGWSMDNDGGIAVPAGEAIVEIPTEVEDAIGRQWAHRNGLI